MRTTKQRRKMGVAAVLAVCLAAAAAVGTVAFLTAQSTVTNSFTVGKITQPEKTPDKQPESEDKAITGNIYEEFVQDSTIGFGGDVVKKPYVGMGAGSEDAYVFMAVQNNVVNTNDTRKDAYFLLQNGWKPVPDMITDNGSGGYVSGLFMWCGTDGGSTAQLLSAKDGEKYTDTPLFDKVKVPAASTGSNVSMVADPTVDVSCFLYAPGADAPDASVAQRAAEDWFIQLEEDAQAGA